MKRKIEPMHDEHVNVTPLIDVVMCLIIFFLMVGKLVKDEAIDMHIPRATLGQEMEEQAGRLTINIVPPEAPAGWDKSQPRNRSWGPPSVKLRGEEVIKATNGWQELTTRLRKEKAENPDLKVILRADQEEGYEWIAPVLVACAQADIKNVNYSTKR